MKNTDKVTLTIGQLKKLIKESKTIVKESIELLSADRNKQMRTYKMTPDDVIGAWTGESLYTSPDSEILKEIYDNDYFGREVNKYFDGDMRKLVKFLKAHKGDSIVVKQFPNPEHDDYWQYKETFKIGGIPFIGYGIEYFDEEDLDDDWFYGDEETDNLTWEDVLATFQLGSDKDKQYLKTVIKYTPSNIFERGVIEIAKRLLAGEKLVDLKRKYTGEIKI